eukprot:CAMPEP_0115284448 /NCGR_PEP_ID=MMETSP0270-20121206/60901_1 /TAXON_ID=71861 /ORGANISM="Scrippsiella trochoidea, Strain CCMP3099" /LENGTH=46 /DNA_ID= /DNA_START= /DNA_END= /DNA_ORIENTATION=
MSRQPRLPHNVWHKTSVQHGAIFEIGWSAECKPARWERALEKYGAE